MSVLDRLAERQLVVVTGKGGGLQHIDMKIAFWLGMPAVGLLLEGRDQFVRGEVARAQVAGIGGVAERMKLWFKANF